MPVAAHPSKGESSVPAGWELGLSAGILSAEQAVNNGSLPGAMKKQAEAVPCLGNAALSGGCALGQGHCGEGTQTAWGLLPILLIS